MWCQFTITPYQQWMSRWKMRTKTSRWRRRLTSRGWFDDLFWNLLIWNYLKIRYLKWLLPDMLSKHIYKNWIWSETKCSWNCFAHLKTIKSRKWSPSWEAHPILKASYTLHSISSHLFVEPFACSPSEYKLRAYIKIKHPGTLMEITHI